MMRAAATMRWLALTAILVGLLSPISTLQTIAQESTGTGSLVINLSDSESGAAIGGASYDVTDASGATQSVADGAGSGSVQVDGLAPGTATVTQTGTASGYDLSGGSVEIVGGSIATLDLYNTQLVTETPPAPPDTDADGVSDDVDNCVDVYNPDQANNYGEWLGDACEAPPPPDDDADGVGNDVDDCPSVANDQTDSDGDGVGDACEPIEELTAEPTAVPTAEPVDEPTATPKNNKKSNDSEAQIQDPLEIQAGGNKPHHDFAGAEPGTYDPVTGANAGGSFAQQREELNAEDLTCGQIVVFYDLIDYQGPSGAYGVDFSFGRESTNGLLVGFGAFGFAEVFTGDAANSGLDGNEVATGSASIDADSVNVHVNITNLESGESIVIRIGVQLICREDATGQQGEVQSRLISEGGQQTVGLKLHGIPPAPPEISVVKYCPASAVTDAGQTIVYQIDISNIGLQTVFIENGGLVDSRAGSFHADAAGTTPLAYPLQIDPGLTLSVYFKSIVTAGDIANANVDNTVTGIAVSDTTIQDPLTISQEATATCGASLPAIEIIKTATDGNGNEITEANIGDIITYVYEVENTGNVDLHDVTVIDDNGTPGDDTDDFECVIGDLASGAVDTSCSFDHAVTVADAIAGSIHNVAVVTGSPPEGDDVSDEDDAEVTINVNPHLTATVECPIFDGAAHIGDEVVFPINVLNDGDVPLSNLVPSTLRAGSFSPLSDLDPGEDVDITFTTNLTAGELLAGSISFDFAVSGVFQSITVNANGGTDCSFVPFVDLAITKTADDPEVIAGNPIGFTIKVENLGEGIAHGVVIDDILPGQGSFDWDVDPDDPNCDMLDVHLICDIGDLNPGDTYSVHVVAETTPEDCGTVENTATVAFDDDGADFAPSLFVQTNDPQENNTSTATIFLQCPDIEIVKIATSDGVTEISEANLGETITFAYTVTNTGNVDLTNVTVFDDDATPGDSSDDVELIDCEVALLPVGASTTCELDHLVTEADWLASPITNIATATGTPPLGPDVSDADDATVDITAPDLTVLKTADAPFVRVGVPIAFRITIDNIGDGTAKNVVLTDQLPAGFAWLEAPDLAACTIDAAKLLTCNIGDLAPAAPPFVVHVVAPTLPSDPEDCGEIVNTATVRAGNEPGDDDGLDLTLFTEQTTNSSTATTFVQCPSIRIDKIATDGTNEITKANVGDTIVYKYAVTNTGNVNLTNVTVVDDNGTPGNLLDDDTCSIGALAVGVTDTSCTLNHLVTEADWLASPITNIATATGTPPLRPDVSATDDATVEITAPDVTVIKTADAPEVTVGDEIGFTIAVSNIGDGVAHDVVLNDGLVAGLNWSEDPDHPDCEIASDVLHCEFGDLSPADPPFEVHITATSTEEYCVGIENTATVTAANEPGALVGNNEGTAFVEVDCPDIEIVKTATDGVVEITETNIGDTIVYKYEVTNAGDVDLHDVTVVDDNGTPAILADDFTCVIGDLAVGATDDTTCFQNHLVTIADAFASPIINVAVATGKSPLEVEVTDDDDAEIEIIANPHLTLTVECPMIEGIGHVGDEVIFPINVLNDGDVPLITLLATSPTHPGGLFSTLPPDLDPGEGVDITFTTQITPAEALLGLISLQVHVNGAFLSTIVDVTGGQDCEFSPFVNVAVTKTADAASVTAPDPIGFAIEVTNDGESTATDVTLNDPLPQGDILNWAMDPDNADCDIDGSGVLTCDFGDLDVGDTHTVHVVADSDFENCDELTNTVTIAASNESPGEDADNTASAGTDVNCPDMTVSALADSPVVTSGDPVGFTITGSNIGEGQARDATLIAPLPDGLTWTIDGPPTIASSTSEGPAAFMAQGISAAQIECVPSGNVIDCTFDDMDPGISITFHVTATSDPEFCGTLETLPTVAATNEPSTALANNGGFAFLITVACPQVSVNKVADAATVVSGEDIGFTIMVSNQAGEGEAVGVSLTDTLPANPGLDWSIDGGSNASDCVIAAGVLTCDFGSLLDGEVVDVHISSPTVANETCGLVTNTATVNAINEQEEDLADNESTDSVEVGCALGATPEIDIDKAATDGSGNEISQVDVGDTITYIFTVTNTSDVDLNDIVVVDDNLTPGDTSDDITLTNCTATALASGESMTCSLTHVVTEAEVGTITNVAVVTAHDPDDEEVTDADDATVTVGELGEPVTELPNTGQGESAGMDDTSWLLILSLTTMLGGAAYALRRRRAA